MKHTTSPVFLFLALSVGIFFSCSKSSNSTPALAITAINPTHGPVGETVTITGSGFGSSPSLNSVSFNGKMATVITASATQLQATVPSLCGTGNIKVSTNGNAAPGPIFTYDTTYLLTTFATGFNSPEYLTMDGAGNLYVTNFGTAAILKISSTGVVSTFANGIFEPTGITIDANNNIYVASNTGLNLCAILQITPAGAVDTLAHVTGFVYGLTIDNSGNLFAANGVIGGISKITGSGTVTTFATGMADITGIAISGNGNLYATATTNGAVYKITPDGSVTSVHSGFSFGTANGLIVDNNNNIYMTVIGDNTLGQYNTVTKIDGAGTITTLITGLDIPVGLIMDGAGNFYIVNQASTANPGTHIGTLSKLTVQ